MRTKIRTEAHIACTRSGALSVGTCAVARPKRRGHGWPYRVWQVGAAICCSHAQPGA